MYLIQVPDHLASQLIERLTGSATHPEPADADYYTSKALPPDCPSKRTFHAHAPKIPDAVKRGRVWLVPVDAWNEYRAKPEPVAPGLPAGFRKVA